MLLEEAAFGVEVFELLAVAFGIRYASAIRRASSKRDGAMGGLSPPLSLVKERANGLTGRMG